eukprot:1186864-Prorocentrum_minimum.AAC.7
MGALGGGRAVMFLTASRKRPPAFLLPRPVPFSLFRLFPLSPELHFRDIRHFRVRIHHPRSVRFGIGKRASGPRSPRHSALNNYTHKLCTIRYGSSASDSRGTKMITVVPDQLHRARASFKHRNGTD